MEFGKCFCLVLIIVLGFLVGVKVVVAKSLSYVGGIMVMIENDEIGNIFSFDYIFLLCFVVVFM